MKIINAMSTYGAEQAENLYNAMRTYAASYFDSITLGTETVDNYEYSKIVCIKEKSSFEICVPNSSNSLVIFRAYENGQSAFSAYVPSSSPKITFISKIVVAGKAIVLIPSTANGDFTTLPVILARDTAGHTCILYAGTASGVTNPTSITTANVTIQIMCYTMGAGLTNYTFHTNINSDNKIIAFCATNYYSVLDGVYIVASRPFFTVSYPFSMVANENAYCSVLNNLFMILDE